MGWNFFKHIVNRYQLTTFAVRSYFLGPSLSPAIMQNINLTAFFSLL